MALQKQWTAGDLRMNRLRAYLDENAVLHVIQGYSFVDLNGDVLTVIPDRTVSVAANWADVPQNVKDGLTDLNAYMYDLALDKEGMK